MRIVITQDRLKELLDYDPDTGIFVWKTRTSNSVRVGDVAGCSDGCGYTVIKVDKRLYRGHRLAWLYIHGTMPDDELDHINGDGMDNRIANLRQVTRRQNMQNLRSGHRDSTSRYLGVSWNPRDSNWRAVIVTNGRKQHLGHFKIEEDARDAYLAAKAILHPFGSQ